MALGRKTLYEMALSIFATSMSTFQANGVIGSGSIDAEHGYPGGGGENFGPQ